MQRRARSTRQTADSLGKERNALLKLEKECFDRVNQVCGKKAMSSSVECLSFLNNLVARIEEGAPPSDPLYRDSERVLQSAHISMSESNTNMHDATNVILKRYLQVLEKFRG